MQMKSMALFQRKIKDIKVFLIYLCSHLKSLEWKDLDSMKFLWSWPSI